MRLKKFWNGHATYNVDAELAERFTEASADKTKLESLKCPSCGDASMRALRLERSKTGWEILFKCQSCNTQGLANPMGFRFDMKIKGQPLEEEQP